MSSGPGRRASNRIPLAVAVLVTDRRGPLMLTTDGGPAPAGGIPGPWPLLTGPVEAGEDVFDAAARIVFSEAGLHGVDPASLVELFTITWAKGCPAQTLAVWSAVLDEIPRTVAWSMRGALSSPTGRPSSTRLPRSWRPRSADTSPAASTGPGSGASTPQRRPQGADTGRCPSSRRARPGHRDCLVDTSGIATPDDHSLYTGRDKARRPSP
ncbi:NUDIX hydrolase [Kitasatospora sp. NPDC001574]